MNHDWKAYFWQVWEENRRLTLKVAKAFSDDQLQNATPVPGMRPFAEMLAEIVGFEHFLIHGLAEGDWEWLSKPADSAELYNRLTETRAYTRQVWPTISEEQWLTAHPAPPGFGGSDAPPLEWLQGALENEVHHRAQAYTYLRHLGVEPPDFWDRED